MFEYKGKFYNPRYVFSISRVQPFPNGTGAFTVDWVSGESTEFAFESADDADQQRQMLAIQVNRSNGAG